MRWFWFATFTLICSLLSVFLRQPLILIGELFIIDLFITRKIKWFSRLSRSRTTVPSWLNLIIWLIATVWVIRVLAIDSLTVLSPAGKPKVQPGDNVLVSKIHTGPRLPVKNFRLSGLAKVRRGDLLAFNFPEGDSIIQGMEPVSYYSLKRKSESENKPFQRDQARFRPISRRTPEINRCMGLPGDTVTICADTSGEMKCNYSSILVSYDYLVEVKNSLLPPEFLSRLGLGPSEVQILPGLGYLLPLTADQVIMVRRRPETTAVSAYFQESGRGDYNIFPHNAAYPWNRDNFGPVVVPRKNDSVRLNMLNISLYRRIIEVYENNRLDIRNNQIYINGILADTYTFRQNYYFILGDSRHHSRDSRHWGFLPEDHIIGKPLFIWFSAYRNSGQPLRIYWNRILNIL